MKKKQKKEQQIFLKIDDDDDWMITLFLFRFETNKIEKSQDK